MFGPAAVLFFIALSVALQAHAEAAPREIQCTPEKILVESAGKKLACVYPDTAAILEARGWSIVLSYAQDAKYTPKLPTEIKRNLFGLEIAGDAILYHVDASALRHQNEIREAFMAWQDLNPGFEFVRVYSERDSTLSIFASSEQDEDVYSELGEYSGFYRHPDAEIYYILGGLDCNDSFRIHSDDTVRDIITHEIGHHLGLGHTTDMNHLMYGDDGTSPELFDGMNYIVPAGRIEANAFAGQADLHGKITLLDSELKVLLAVIEEKNARYDGMSEEYSQYPDVMYDDFVYDEANALYYDLLDLQKEINGDVLEYNGMSSEHNDAVDAFNCYYGS